MQEANPHNLVLVSQFSQTLLGSAITTEMKDSKLQGLENQGREREHKMLRTT